MAQLTLTKIAEQGSYVVSKAEGYEARIIESTSKRWAKGDELLALLNSNDVDIINGENAFASLRALKVLVYHSKARRRSEKPMLKIVKPGTYFQDLLECTGTKDHFDVYPTLESALEADKQSRI